MATDSYSSLGSIAGLISQVLLEAGCDPGPIFREVGIDRKCISLPGIRFPSDKMRRLWDSSVLKTNDDCFGFTVGEKIQPTVLHGLGFSTLSSDTLGDALLRMSRYSRMVCTNFTIELAEKENRVEFYINPLMDVMDFGYTRMDFGLSVILQMSRICTRQMIQPKKLTLVRDQPTCHKTIENFIQAPVIYNADRNAISFSKEQMLIPLPSAHPELARINDQSVIDYLARFDRDSISMQVRLNIIEMLQGGTPSQDDIATCMNMSLRSLQRRLQEENTNFTTLLRNTRKELATQYLKEPHRTLGEVTYLLGFTEPANFTRAFKRWTGQSPSEFRELR